MKRSSPTLKAIAALYRASPAWHNLSVGSRKLYSGAMLGPLADLMEMEADKITRPMIIDFRDALYEKRATCRIALVTLNNILGYGYDRGMCSHNHAGSMKHLPKSIPIPRWTPEECERFEAEAPPHLRRAFLLALYTGQRRSDLVHMRWDQYDGKTIRVLQQKTKTVLRIPVHPKLKAELDSRADVLINVGKKMILSPYMIHNIYGQPWTNVNLSQSFTRICRKLNMEGKSIHGLRKTTAAVLAELGCTPHQIAAVTGHKSLKEVMNYTKEADQRNMAEEAIARWS